MILYFDTFITDKSLVKWEALDLLLEGVRCSSPIYRSRSKLEIVKYTLASYSVINWSNVYIRFEIEEEELRDEFFSYVLGLFPNAKIEFQRSTKQDHYIETIRYLKTLNDKWIFYAPNNDHPFISNNKHVLDNIVVEAQKLSEVLNTSNISITYSHFSESVNSCKNRWVYDDEFQLINEYDDYYLVKYPNGYLVAISVVNIDLLEQWFSSYDYDNNRIVRTEDLMGYEHPEQFVLIPKSEICRHYDGYGHTSLLYNDLRSIPFHVVPPLFIPDGFFENNIRINYNFIEYREGWVNINPYLNNYSFIDNLKGTDLKLVLDQLPYFWLSRISEISRNSLSDNSNLKIVNYIDNPIQAYNLKTRFLYFIKYALRLVLNKLR